MNEEVFYKDLYLYLTTWDSFDPWKWKAVTDEPLNIVLSVYHALRHVNFTNPHLRVELDIASVKADAFADALYRAVIKHEYQGLVEYVRDVKTVRDGFCWLLLSTMDEKAILPKVFECAIRSPFGYAKVCYGKWLEENGKTREAFEMFDRAVKEHNDCHGWRRLGVCYADGIGTDTNNEQAFYCFKTAAKLGHTGCIMDIACGYWKGRGTYMSYTKALKWFHKWKYTIEPDGVKQLRKQKSLIHNGTSVPSPFYQPAVFIAQKYQCDCFECRTILYFIIPFIERRPRSKWFARWDKCKEMCFVMVACFHRVFGAKGIGKMVARHIWRTRAEDCWKHRIKN